MKVHEVRWEGVSAIRFGQGNTERGVTVLPKNVQDWAGLKTQEGSFNDNVYTYYEDLTVLNDGGNDFYRIADAIEDNVDKL